MLLKIASRALCDFGGKAITPFQSGRPDAIQAYS